MAVLVYKDARLCTADGDLAVHRFERAAGTSPNGAVVVVFHGYGAHAHFPTVRYAAEVLAAAGNVVYCLDFPGHGASPGTCGLVRSSEQLTTIGRAMARWATEQQPDRALALFGSSMGGAIALNVCRREPDIVATVVVAAPMLGIAPASLPPVWQQNLLWGMAWLAPAAALLPQANQTDLAQQYRDPVRRKECAADELAYSGWMRLGSACACLETAIELSENFEEISTPFLCLAAGKDTVVDTSGPSKLMARASTAPEHKRLIEFPEALHGLLCEPMPSRGEIEAAVVEWVAKYS